MTRPDRAVLDLDDPAQLAEATSLGVVGPADLTTERLARLGRAHTELLAAQGETADKAQLLALELDATKIQLEIARGLNGHLRSLIASGRLREQNGPAPIGGEEATDLMIAAAHVLAPDTTGVLGLLLSATVTACLNAEHPAAALDASCEIFKAAGLDFERITAPSPSETPS